MRRSEVRKNVARLQGVAIPEEPNRYMRLLEAADYIAVSPSYFMGMVKRGTMSPPSQLGAAVRVWDRLLIEKAINKLRVKAKRKKRKKRL